MTNQNFKVTPDLYATKGNRFANYIVDLLAIILVFWIVVFGAFYLFYSFATDTTPADNLIFYMENLNPLLDRLITAIVLAFVYFSIEMLTKGRSIGKYITKTKVVLADGTKPTASDYLKRSFSRMIPFEALSFLGSQSRGWHDTISKTFVVNIDKFEAKKKTFNELDQIGVAQETE
ncbi:MULTISPECIES: RDD family protein [Hwangdonia]|uniref:RDD family protein n=1 Tax=Hwangdonia seohaensis TaxID=1240727 RepID=A0ABW3R7M0_9FLAO|nr:RDD family protein [Hwangdonia seohaensis]